MIRICIWIDVEDQLFGRGILPMKEHKKLYKAGKLWLTATIALVAGGIMLTNNAKADTVTDNQPVATTQAVQTAPTATTQQQFAATNNQEGQANEACLDSAQLTNSPANNNTVQLVATGWHAADASQTDTYRYAIMYDNTAKKEIQRVKVTEVARPDVQRAYPGIANSQKAGFKASFAIPTANLTHSLSLVSRYSNAANGEGQHVDKWLPVNIDLANHAYLDGVEVNGNKVRVHGWHATNQALQGRSHHFIIAFDRTQGREIARQEMTNYGKRSDVAKAYPKVLNAGVSGFDVNFALNPAFVNDEIQIISRWSADAKGNKNYTDNWFNPQRLFKDKVEHANLDHFAKENGQLKIAGWHASNQTYGKKYHYIIVLDKTTGKEVARQKVTTQSRPDVANALPQVYGAANSGFEVTIPFAQAWDGHRLQVVDRWTNDPAGNSSSADAWLNEKQFGQQPAAQQPSTQQPSTQHNGYQLKSGEQFGDHDRGVGNIDHWLYDGDTNLYVSGWHAFNYHGLIGQGMNTNCHESHILYDNTAQRVVSWDCGPTEGYERPDVAKIYGNQYDNAAHSGLRVLLVTDGIVSGHDYSFISQLCAGYNHNYEVDRNGKPTGLYFHLGKLQKMVPTGTRALSTTDMDDWDKIK